MSLSQDWKPISSAKMDGTKILVTDGKEQYVAYWHQVFDDEFVPNEDGTFSKRNRLLHEAWCAGTCDYRLFWIYGMTHWMPLPPSIADEATASEKLP